MAVCQSLGQPLQHMVGGLPSPGISCSKVGPQVTHAMREGKGRETTHALEGNHTCQKFQNIPGEMRIPNSPVPHPSACCHCCLGNCYVLISAVSHSPIKNNEILVRKKGNRVYNPLAMAFNPNISKSHLNLYSYILLPGY